MKRIYPQDSLEIPFDFKQSMDDFIVTERNSSFSNKGNYLIIEVEKKNMTTLEMLKVFEEYTQYHAIGYAGLKDKYATTTQYLSFPRKYIKDLQAFSHQRIRIVSYQFHHEKISLGDLEGNHFFIRLKQVDALASKALEQMIETVRRQGIPNYFGFQRFGKDTENFEKCREVAHGDVFVKDKKMQKLLTSAYQSYLFNDWLASRVIFSKDIEREDLQTLQQKYALDEELTVQLKAQPFIFKVIPGDILRDQQSNKLENVADLQSIRKGVKEQKLVPTGLLCGRKAWRSKDQAAAFEEPYDDIEVDASGERRLAWIYPKEIRYEYKSGEKFFEIAFFLPRGSYATVLLENLGQRNLG